jgi:NADPH:quinone reductase-like Zn-dependent oxidoreductase
MGIFRPRRPIQGTMFSGRITEVGAQVQRFAVGDAVFGAVDAGAWAEQLVIDADGAIAHRPSSHDDEHAAAVPYGAGTALHFLVDLAEVQPGERVLIVGGSGGVGRFAIQVARHLGARVTAMGSADRLEQMRRLGAHEVLDHREVGLADLRASGARYDVVFDIAGVTRFRDARPLLPDTGRYLTLTLSLHALFAMAGNALRSGPRALFAVSLDDREGMERLAEWMFEGALQPVVAHRFELADAVSAHETAERRPAGSVVLLPVPRGK